MTDKDLAAAAWAAAQEGHRLMAFGRRKAQLWRTDDLKDLTPEQVTDRTLAGLRAGTASGFGIAVGTRSLVEEADGLWLTAVFEVEGRARASEGWAERWADAATRVGADEILQRLADSCEEESPSGGTHWPFRVQVRSEAEVTAQIGSLEALAALVDVDAEDDAIDVDGTGDVKKTATYAELLIRPRWVICAPSGGHTHETGRPWRSVRGSLADMAILTWPEVHRLASMLAELSEVTLDETTGERSAPLDARTMEIARQYRRQATTELTVEALGRMGWTATRKTLDDGAIEMSRDGSCLLKVGGQHMGAGDVFSWSTNFPLGNAQCINAFAVRAWAEGLDQAALAERLVETGEVRLRIHALAPRQRTEVRPEATETTELAATIAQCIAEARHPVNADLPFVLSHRTADDAHMGFVSLGANGVVRRWAPSDEEELALRVVQPVRDTKTGQTTLHGLPAPVISMSMATAQDAARPVHHIAPRPILLPDGGIASTAGYHSSQRALVAIPMRDRPRWAKGYSVPEHISADDAQTALDWLVTEVITDFPFASAANRARALAYLLTVVSRSLYGNAPGWLFTAPDRGTGKDLLASVGRIIATGSTIAQSLPAGNSSETPKAVATGILAGRAFMHLAEMPRGTVYRDNAVQEYLTGDGASTIRALGGHREVLVSGLTWTFCGNNAEIGSDFVRRLLPIEMAYQGAGLAYERTAYRHADLLDWVRTNRPAILARCHTVLAYGLRQSSAYTLPDGHGLGGFEAWASVVMRSLSHVQIEGQAADVLLVSDRREWTETQDDEGSEWSELMLAWHAEFAEAWAKPSTAVDRMQRHSVNDPALPACLVQAYGTAANSRARDWGRQLRLRAKTRVRIGDQVAWFEERRNSKGSTFRVVMSDSDVATSATVTSIADGADRSGAKPAAPRTISIDARQGMTA